MKEFWKDIEGYEGYYQVSTQGRVRSVDRTVQYKGGTPRQLKGRVLYTSVNHNGYPTVVICKEHKTALLTIHRLVAKAFIPNPENKDTVNHIDGNKLNNSVLNLEWVTRRENNMHALKNGLMKFPPKPVIRSDGVVFESICAAARSINVDPKNLQRVLKGKQKTMHGYGFELM